MKPCFKLPGSSLINTLSNLNRDINYEECHYRIAAYAQINAGCIEFLLYIVLRLSDITGGFLELSLDWWTWKLNANWSMINADAQIVWEVRVSLKMHTWYLMTLHENWIVKDAATASMRVFAYLFVGSFSRFKEHSILMVQNQSNNPLMHRVCYCFL